MKIIITENQQESIKIELQSMVKDIGWDLTAKIVNGSKKLAKLAFNNDPMEFLNIYNDLDFVQSKEEENVTLFRFKKSYNLMYYNRKNRYIDINNNDIWSVLRNTFGLTYGDTEALIKVWVETTYNLKGTTPEFTGKDINGKWWRLHTI